MSTKPTKVLLADDEEDIKTILRMFLESRGYSVTTAFDGLDALSVARAEKPDIILLDVMMPVIDGFEVARRLKADEATAAIPIVMLSAASHAAAVQKGIAAGAADYIAQAFRAAHRDRGDGAGAFLTRRILGTPYFLGAGCRVRTGARRAIQNRIALTRRFLLCVNYMQ